MEQLGGYWHWTRTENHSILETDTEKLWNETNSNKHLTVFQFMRIAEGSDTDLKQLVNQKDIHKKKGNG